MHSGRRSSIDPASLVPPDSPLARDAEVAAQDLLTPVLLNHSSRAYTWGAAIAQRTGLTERDLDNALWYRGQRPEYKARPRHRCRTVYY